MDTTQDDRDRAEAIRVIAKEIDVAVPADEAIGRTRRHDSDRILRETAQALEALVMGIGLITITDLEPAEAKTWAVSIASSTRTLTQFTKQVKETTQ